MTPTAPNSRMSDPRIVSPQIKVIYPSQSAEKDLQVSSEQSNVPTPQVLPTAPTPEVVPTKETPVIPATVTPQAILQTETTNVTTVKSTTWKDTLKDHAQLFIAVALISIGIGILIGKKI